MSFARVSRATEPKEGERIVQLCAFVVGQEEYVIDIMRIREIIQPVRITSVPQAPAYLEGVINLRGAIIPVVDLRKRLGVAPNSAASKNKYIICSVGGRRVGLMVDAVTEVVRIPRDAIQKTPSLLSKSSFFMGVYGPPDRLKLLLNIQALLTSSDPVPAAPVRALARGQEPPQRNA